MVSHCLNLLFSKNRGCWISCERLFSMCICFMLVEIFCPLGYFVSYWILSLCGFYSSSLSGIDKHFLHSVLSVLILLIVFLTDQFLILVKFVLWIVYFRYCIFGGGHCHIWGHLGFSPCYILGLLHFTHRIFINFEFLRIV